MGKHEGAIVCLQWRSFQQKLPWGFAVALLTLCSRLIILASARPQKAPLEGDEMQTISITAAAVVVATLCVLVGWVVTKFMNQAAEKTPTGAPPRVAEAGRRRTDRSAMENLMRGGAGVGAGATRAAAAPCSDLQAAQKKREEREQRREQRRQQAEASTASPSAAAAAAAAAADSASENEGAPPMSHKQAKQEAYRKRQAEKDRLRAEREAEEERLAEEKRKKEQEEYEEWKKTFEIEAEGELNISPEEEARQLEQFLTFIKMRKAVELEEIAAEFGLKTKECVKRIEALRESGRLCGVLDDRGRFLCLTQEELEQVAEALVKLGRFSKETDLVSICNRIIKLTPSEEDKAKIEEEQRASMRLIELAAAED